MKRDPIETISLVAKTGKDLSTEFWVMVMERFFKNNNDQVSMGILTSILISFMGYTSIQYKEMYESQGNKAHKNIDIVLLTKVINALTEIKEKQESRAEEALK